MKKLFPVLVFLLGCLTTGHTQSIRYDHTIPILQDVVPTENHQAKDVFVIHAKDRYTIVFFIKHSGKVNKHIAHVVEDKTFTSASYTWVTPNKIAVRLFDANSNNAFELKVYGDKNGTGMQIATDDNGKIIESR